MREDRFLEKGRGKRTLLPEEGRKEEEGGVRSDLMVLTTPSRMKTQRNNGKS